MSKTVTASGDDSALRAWSAPRRRTGMRWDSGRVATLCLCVLILSITLGPRIRVGLLDHGRAIDLRPQDLFLVPALCVAFVVHGRTARSAMRSVWGMWCGLLCYVTIVVTIIHMLGDTDIRAFKRIAFLGRHLEVFLLAAVVCALYRHGGDRAAKWALRTIHFVVFANVAWCAYQVITGTTGTLLGSGVGDHIQSYGPKLVGEPSSFGTGSFFAFVAALAIAEYRARLMSRAVSVLMFVIAVAGAYLAESRVSLGAIAGLAVLFVVQRDVVRSSRMVKALLVALLGIGLTVYLTGHANSRMTEGGLQHSMQVRLTDIWEPIWRLANDPMVVILGIGPGGLATNKVPMTEAHNLFFRAWLDFGVVGALLLFATLAVTFVRAYRFSRRAEVPSRVRLYADLAWLSGVWVVISGLVQDAFTPVTSTHLVMLAVGLFAGQWALYADKALPVRTELPAPPAGQSPRNAVTGVGNRTGRPLGNRHRAPVADRLLLTAGAGPGGRYDRGSGSAKARSGYEDRSARQLSDSRS